MHAPCRLSANHDAHDRVNNTPRAGIRRPERARSSARLVEAAHTLTVVSTPDPPRDRYFTLRGDALKRWVRIHLWVYRKTRGRLLSKMRGMPTVLLTTTGRRSGRRHTVPLPYFEDGKGKVVIGSFAGGDKNPAWVLNLVANPAVEVQDRGDVYR